MSKIIAAQSLSILLENRICEVTGLGKFIDLTGQRFGRLVVVALSGQDKHGGTKWLCKCDCGSETVVLGGNLRRNHTTSCGCVHKETISTHGESKSRLYTIWTLMKRRCYFPSDSRYHRYGGRCIAVCEEWRDSFENFRDWATKNGYRDDLTIDRIDNNGNYCPGNCRWATRKEQQSNIGTNHLITHNGETLTVSQWAERIGVQPTTLFTRLRRHWSIERALNRKE